MESPLQVWDSVELWLSTLPFPPQVAILVAVLVPLSFVIARVLIVVTDAFVSPRLVDVIRGRDEAAEEELE
ncbi:hypothetical protein [Dietzia timorensis]|jgi:hypothetical protein|uniref:Uncharacterized protein n=1 Tax=Dietzia timorensis TaxID=499555 RepID=A0A173LKJ2_9ACTN|nr:hypothetical protein [Dietzia timorensis]ANI92028.1 Hypothetical protein BJL86_1243 [Dietzia timorensis]